MGLASGLGWLPVPRTGAPKNSEWHLQMLTGNQYQRVPALPTPLSLVLLTHCCWPPQDGTD